MGRGYAASWASALRGLAADRAPRQAAQLLGQSQGRGLSVAMRPAAQPLVAVQEELPVADDRVPHEQEGHGRLEGPEAAVVDGGAFVAFVEPANDQSVL